MTASDLRLNSVQESALRESTETGEWHPLTAADQRVAEYLRRRGLFECFRIGWGGGRGYALTAAGRDWLATHPTEVAR